MGARCLGWAIKAQFCPLKSTGPQEERRSFIILLTGGERGEREKGRKGERGKEREREGEG